MEKEILLLLILGLSIGNLYFFWIEKNETKSLSSKIELLKLRNKELKNDLMLSQAKNDVLKNVISTQENLLKQSKNNSYGTEV